MEFRGVESPKDGEVFNYSKKLANFYKVFKGLFSLNKKAISRRNNDFP